MANLNDVDVLKKGYRRFNRWKKKNKENIDFTNYDFTNFDFSDYDLRDCNFQNSVMKNTKFRRAIMIRTNLTGVDLSYSDFRDVEFSDISGNSANLTRAKLIGAKFTDRYGDPGAGFLELASTIGLETAIFEKSEFLENYISDAYRYTLENDLPEKKFLPKFYENVLNRIKILEKIDYGIGNLQPLKIVIQFVSDELLKKIRNEPNLIRDLTSRGFEKLISELLSRQGFDLTLTQATRDGGYDLFGIEHKQNGMQKWLIECKKYKPQRKVGIDIVRNLYGTRFLNNNYNSKLMIATTSTFTSGVEKLSSSRYDLYLRNYNDIINWINN